MAWQKNRPETVAWFEKVAGIAGAERDVLFGCPFFLLNGERYAMLWQNQLVLRLSDKDGERLMALGGKIFEPMKGRSKKGRFVVPAAITDDTRAVKGWVKKAIAYAG
jgi:hypothetical protein